MAFTLPALSYSNDALEPNIDAKTMEIHHGKHHNGYTTKLNTSIEGSDLENKSIEEILKNTGIKYVANKVLGEDCGCDERKEKLNEKFPYKK